MDVGVTWDCPPGFVADPKAPYKPHLATPCIPDPKSCTDKPWSGVKLPSDTVFVRADAKSGGDGSSGKPVQSLAVALKKVKAGGVIAVDAGVYVGPFAVNKAVSIRGRCAAKVTLSGKSTAAVLAVEATPTDGDVVVSGLTITGDGVGLRIRYGATVSVRHVLVHQATDVGVAVAGGGRLAMQDTIVEHTKVTHNTGQGIRVNSDGHASLRRVRVHKNRRYGVEVIGDNAVLIGDHVLIDGTDGDGGLGMLGYGLVVAEKARVELRSSRSSSNRDAGVAARQEAFVNLRGVVIDNTRQQELTWNYGFGMLVFGGCHVQLDGVRMHRNLGAGLDVDGLGTLVDVNGVIIDGTLPQIGNSIRGEGIAATTKARINLRSVRISDGYAAGIRSEAEDTQVHLDGVVVDHIRAELATGSGGVGIYAVNAGAIHGRGLRVTDTRASGLIVAGKNAAAELEDVLIDGTRPTKATGGQGYGALFGDTAQVRLRRARFSDNRGAGVMVINVGTSLRAEDLLIDGTASTSPQKPTGQGMVVALGARAIVAGGRISGNHVAGASVLDKNSRLDLAGVLVDGTRADPTKLIGGAGIMTVKDTAITLTGCRVHGNRFVGVAVQEAKDPVAIVGTQVTGTLAAKTGDFRYGTGLSVNRGTAVAAIIASVFRRNRSAGITVTDASAHIVDSVVGHTAAETMLIESGGGSSRHIAVKMSDGIVAHRVKNLRVIDSLLHDHSRAGLVTQDVKNGRIARVEVARCTIGRAGTRSEKVEVASTLLTENETNRASGSNFALPKPPSLAGL